MKEEPFYKYYYGKFIKIGMVRTKVKDKPPRKKF